MYRSKPTHNMEKFPEDVIRAETAVGGDIEILTRDEFQEVKKESYREIFIDPTKKTSVSGKKGHTYLCVSVIVCATIYAWFIGTLGCLHSLSY